MRRDPLYRPIVPAENDARDMRAVLTSRTPIRRAGHQPLQLGQKSTAQDGVGQFDRPVENGDANAFRAECLRPDRLEPGERDAGRLRPRAPGAVRNALGTAWDRTGI